VSAARLTVRVQPGARAAGLAGTLADGTLKVRVTAPALEGRANQAVEVLLAERLGVKRSQVRVTRGAGSRLKVVEVTGLDPEGLRLRLEAALQAASPDGRTRGD
jgi:uncharacterized protein YggU (UPF0235/DUF167 family)